MKKKEKRILILEAARKLFEERGFHNSKISDIADLAGIGKGTVYEYFDSKQSLFEEMIIYFIELYFEHAEELINKVSDPIKKLRILIELDWEVSRDHGQLVNVIVSRLSQFEDDIKFKFALTREKNLNMVSGIIDRGISTGVFKAVDSRLIALIFKGSFAQANLDRTLFKHMGTISNEDMAFNETTEALFQIFINSIKS